MRTTKTQLPNKPHALSSKRFDLKAQNPKKCQNTNTSTESSCNPKQSFVHPKLQKDSQLHMILQHIPIKKLKVKTDKSNPTNRKKCIYRKQISVTKNSTVQQSHPATTRGVNQYKTRNINPDQQTLKLKPRKNSKYTLHFRQKPQQAKQI